MRNLVFTVAALGAASITGACGGGTSSPQGTATVTWDLQDWSDANKTAVPANCPAGADTAIVYELPTSETDASLATKDLFTCADITGTTAPLFADDYQFWVDITDHSGASLFAESETKVASVLNNTNTGVDFKFQVNRAYVTAAWTLARASNGAPLSCGQASATGVEMDETGTGASLVPDQFDCAPMTGTSFPIPLDTYTVSLQALGGSPEGGIGDSTVAGTAALTIGNQEVNKGTVILPISAL